MSAFQIRRGTRDKDLVILNSAFKVLKLRGIIRENPCQDIQRLGDRPSRHEPYTPEELQKLLTYLEEHNHTLLCFCVLVMCAIRPAEILRLQVKDINIAEGFITIKNTKSKNTYTRIARIPAIMLKYLRYLNIQGQPSTYYIFNPSGIPNPRQHLNKSYWSKAYCKTRTTLGLRPEITMYSLKHTILSEMYKADATLGELMSFGGFRTLDALESYLRKYIHHVPDDPSEKLAGLFSKKNVLLHK